MTTDVARFPNDYGTPVDAACFQMDFDVHPSLQEIRNKLVSFDILARGAHLPAYSGTTATRFVVYHFFGLVDPHAAIPTAPLPLSAEPQDDDIVVSDERWKRSEAESSGSLQTSIKSAGQNIADIHKAIENRMLALTERPLPILPCAGQRPRIL